MTTVIISLFIGLIVIIIGYGIIQLTLTKKTDHTSIKGERNYAKKVDLNKWRGGVRFPAGYYKSSEEFYRIEKKLKYHK